LTMLFQKSGAPGASGRMAPTPTIAIALFCLEIMGYLPYSCENSCQPSAVSFQLKTGS